MDLNLLNENYLKYCYVIPIEYFIRLRNMK